MSAFASLMALSATQTKQQESAVEVALRERQRKEALRRKQQDEKDAKDREMEKQRRLKLFEDQKREEERRKRVAEEKAARERAMQRREDEERDRLLYGPKKAAKMASSSASGSRSAPVKRRSSDESDDDTGPIPLTREELRQRKQEREMKRLYGATKKASPSLSGGYQKAGRRLPGGAVDITIDPMASSSSGTEYKSVKERLIAQQNTLVKLNANKRDTRTIDEIVTERAKARQSKVLEGDQAKEFDDWFGTKKKEKEKAGGSRPSSVGPPPTPAAPQVKKPLPPAARPVAPQRPVASSSRPLAAPPRPSVSTKHLNDRAVERVKHAISKSTNKRSPVDPPPLRSSMHAPKKRARSRTRSESPPPKRRHRSPDSDHLDDDDEDVSNTIWQIFGRDRKKYVSRDVFSDDEDMEADARALEREEKASARAAAREEQLALEEERRHEEEKRRRRRERERMGR